MKVGEAKKKWCPFADSGYMWQGFNGDVDKDVISPRCLAGNCMAWKYTKEYTKTAHSKDGGEKHYREDNKPEYRIYLEEKEKEGYCQRLGNAK